jgi:hypothetical protein
MIAKRFETFPRKELGHPVYLLLVLLVSALKICKQVKLELLAEFLPLPILYESRRKKIRRFLRLESLSIERIWLPIVKSLIQDYLTADSSLYIAIDRTSWGTINILMVSVIHDRRAWPIYWKFLDKKGSSNLAEQQAVLSQALTILSTYQLVILGDREFCCVKLGKWLGERGHYFCLRQKKSTTITQKDALAIELQQLALVPGTKLFINDVQVTKTQGFGTFNMACKWKKTYRGFRTKEPWYILTNFDKLEAAIIAYQKRFDIEEMFRDFKSGGYNLEDSKLAPEHLSQLPIVVAIAYTSATLQGQQIKQIGLQKYVSRPETTQSSQRRHSSFYIGLHLHNWFSLGQLCQKTIAELLQINRRWVSYYNKGRRAMELAASTFQLPLSPC